MSGEIITIMRDNPHITIPELAKHLGVVERTVERHIKRLKEDKVITRVGPDKGGFWKVIE